MTTSISPVPNIISFITVDMLFLQGYCDFLTEEQLLKAVEVGQVRIIAECVCVACKCYVSCLIRHLVLIRWVGFGQKAVSEICRNLEDFAAKVGRRKNLSALSLPPVEIEGYIEVVSFSNSYTHVVTFLLMMIGNDDCFAPAESFWRSTGKRFANTEQESSRNSSMFG